MTKKIKRIAMITSGGDCPGLNAVIRAVVTRAYHYGWEVFGIKYGLEGLLKKEPEYMKLSLENFNFFESRIGGSILGCSNRSQSPFDYPIEKDGKVILPAGDKNLIAQYKDAIQKLKIDDVIMTGGDGSMNIGYHLFKEIGVNFIGIPKTIDNDTPLTKFSVGYLSAVDSCVSAMDSVIATAYGHKKWLILEVMGCTAGHIAIRSGIAGGADVILIPEIPYKIEGIVKKIADVKKQEGREYGLMVVAEGAHSDGYDKTKHGNVSNFIVQNLKQAGVEARNLIVGHIQRGCQPNAYDRFLATSFGVKATDALAKGAEYKMVGYDKDNVVVFDLRDVIEVGTDRVKVNSSQIETALGMGVYLGNKRL